MITYKIFTKAGYSVRVEVSFRPEGHTAPDILIFINPLTNVVAQAKFTRENWGNHTVEFWYMEI